MTKRKNNKRALIVSALSLLLCVSMLVGSTMAWFTDNASTGVNKIESGKLDVALQMLVGGEWVDAEGETLGFVDDEGNLLENILWEPGCSYLLQPFKIINNGNLALKFDVVVSGVVGDTKLAEAIEYGMPLGDANNPQFVALGELNDFDSIFDAVEEANLTVLEPNDTFDTAEDQITFHMKEEAGNEYQGLTITGFSITVRATQATVENDSFNNTYDANAEYMAIATAEDKIGTEGGTLTEDMSFTTPFVDTQGATDELTVDGGGHTVQVNTSEPSYLTSSNNSKVTMEDITITGEMPYLSVGNYVSGDAAQKNFTAELNNVAVKNVKVDNFNNKKPVAAVICYGTADLNNCDLSGTTTDAEGHVAFDLMALNNSTVTVNGGYVDKAVILEKGSMIVNGAKINTIETGSHGVNGHVGLVIKSGSEIGTVKAYLYNATETLYKGHAKITIKAGATVDTLDLTGVTVKSDVTIEEGATVGKVIVDGQTVDFDAWKAT